MHESLTGHPIPVEVWDGAARILVATKAVDPDIRFYAFALAVAAWIGTNGDLTEEAIDARRY